MLGVAFIVAAAFSPTMLATTLLLLGEGWEEGVPLVEVALSHRARRSRREREEAVASTDI